MFFKRCAAAFLVVLSASVFSPVRVFANDGIFIFTYGTSEQVVDYFSLVKIA